MSASLLIIDDSASVREQITGTLDSFELFASYHEAKDGLDGFKKLLSESIDMILCDLEMPRMDGFKFLGMMKSRPELQNIPVIILTGINDRTQKIKVLESGACDYITKPFDPEELVARVRVHLKIKKLQDDLKKTNELLHDLSITDCLTGLYNRRYLMDSLNREILRADRKDGSLSLIVIDIDHFKRVNDTYGHQQGDLVLQIVSRIIKMELRNYDIAARFGGEEFFAVLPDVNADEALIVAERIRSAVEEFQFEKDLYDLELTISLGVADLSYLSCQSVDNFIKLADDALYLAKANNRNCVELARHYLI
jgi:two-component system, cell cycle response regulator